MNRHVPREGLLVLWLTGYYSRHQMCLLCYAAHVGLEHSEMWQVWRCGQDVMHLLLFYLIYCYFTNNPKFSTLK